MPGPRSGWDGRDDGHFFLTFPPSVEGLPRARRDFAHWLDRCQVARHIIDELATTFSELTANAVNAAAHTASEAAVSAWRDGNDLVLEVVNATPGPTRPAQRWDLQDQLRSGGRGLQIVHAFVDSVEIDQDERGRLIVRCRRSLTGES